MKTTTLCEVKATLGDNEAAGLTGYREFAEIKGTASSDSPVKTPYSETPVAYYDAQLYQVFEETENYTDDKGVQHQRMNRREDLMSSQKSPGPIVLEDGGEKAYIELVEHGMQLDTVKTLDKFSYNFV